VKRKPRSSLPPLPAMYGTHRIPVEAPPLPPPMPRPLQQHEIKTLFLRVPSAAWAHVSNGRATEFRAAQGAVPQGAWRLPMPTAAVIYRRRPAVKEYDYRLMVLERVRLEALGAITDEGLIAAGYVGEDAFARWRRDWMLQTKRPFEPLTRSFVFTVSQVLPGDLQAIGMALVEHLYGEYIEQASDRVRTVPTESGTGPLARTPRTPKPKPITCRGKIVEPRR
jgi:hypothetical protein